MLTAKTAQERFKTTVKKVKTKTSFLDALQEATPK